MFGCKGHPAMSLCAYGVHLAWLGVAKVTNSSGGCLSRETAVRGGQNCSHAGRARGIEGQEVQKREGCLRHQYTYCSRVENGMNNSPTEM